MKRLPLWITTIVNNKNMTWFNKNIEVAGEALILLASSPHIVKVDILCCKNGSL